MNTKSLMVSLLTVALAAGLLMLSRPASAQSTVTCSVSGSLNLGSGTHNILQCVEGGSTLWTIYASTSTELLLTNVPSSQQFTIPVDEQTQIQECVTGSSACATVTQGLITTGGLQVTLTGTD
jgi:hypothetical protein